MTKEKNLKNELDNLSFEEAMSQLELLVQKMESGQVSLEESVNLYMQGVSLKDYCEKKLNHAKARIEKLVFKEGKANLEPFEEENI